MEIFKGWIDYLWDDTPSQDEINAGWDWGYATPPPVPRPPDRPPAPTRMAPRPPVRPPAPARVTYSVGDSGTTRTVLDPVTSGAASAAAGGIDRMALILGLVAVGAGAWLLIRR